MKRAATPKRDRRVSFTQADIKRAVAGAVAGGMPIGTFGLEISLRDGGIRIFPAAPLVIGEDPLDAEMRELRRRDGVDQWGRSRGGSRARWTKP